MQNPTTENRSFRVPEYEGDWVASEQYGMRFIQSSNGKIIWRCDWMPFSVLKAIVDAANAEFKNLSTKK